MRGNRLPYSPEFKVNVGAQYSLPIDGYWSVTVRGDYVWQDSFCSREFNTPNDRIPSWVRATL